MKVKAILGLALIIMVACRFDALAEQTNGPPQVFKAALEQIKGQVKIPVLLPSKLPADMDSSKLVADGIATDTGYQISLFYEEICGNACFAGAFNGSSKVDRDLPKTRPVKLKNGIIGRFLPIRCGGSCAPANLWWEQGSVMYQIQLRFKSTMTAKKQELVMLEVANSLVPAATTRK